MKNTRSSLRGAEGPLAARDWHAMPIDQCLAAVEGSPGGLSGFQAQARLSRFGPNEICADARFLLLRRFLRQFRSPLIYLLLAALIVSLAIGHGTDALFIGAVLLVNAVIGTAQEYRAETSIAALGKLVRQVARVRRDGAARFVEARELVPGDLVEVESGVAISADLRLVWSNGLAADESSLSGESLPAAKAADAVVPADAGVGDRPTMLHAGTTVAEGRGAGVVVATGTATMLGAIRASLGAAAETPPPLLLRLERLARQIALATGLLIGALSLLLLGQGDPPLEIMMLAVALTVSAIPEGLPIAVTVALAAAARRMAARNVIIRSLPAVEGLGACTVIASDKTGTLTVNRLSVERVVLADGEELEREAFAGADAAPRLRPIARAAALCNEAGLAADGALFGDSVDVALLAFARDLGVDIAEIAGQPRLAAIAYEPSRRFAAAAVEEDGQVRLYVKGAPETVLAMCDAGSAARSEAEALAARGYRVLALAGAPLAGGTPLDCAAPQALKLLGWVALLDPIRPEVPEAITKCAAAGIKVLMITGDHPATALTIGRELGLADSEAEVVAGHALAVADEAAFAALVAKGRIFARIEPEQKLRIVRALEASGELVAVTGDGVNDAPALQAAHVGVAMGQGGTDVARGAADLILSDDNFASIVAGVEEGRITYANVRKIVIFLLATGIAEIAMFLGAVAAGLPMPLTPVQLLWCNLVTNGAQDVMLGFGRGEGDELQRPPRRPREPIVDRRAVLLMLPPALTMSLLALLLAWQGHSRGVAIEETRNAVLLLTVLFQNAYVLCMRSERRSLLAEPIASNPWLLLGIALALALQVAAMLLSPLRAVLGTGPVGAEVLLFCGAGVLLILLVTELTKAVVASGRRRLGSITDGSPATLA